MFLGDLFMLKNLIISSLIPLLISGISTVGGIWGATIQARKYEDSKRSKLESYEKILEIIDLINALYLLIQDNRWNEARKFCFEGIYDDLDNKLRSGVYVLLIPKNIRKNTVTILDRMVEIVEFQEKLEEKKPHYTVKYNVDMLEVRKHSLHIDYGRYISKVKRKYRLFK